MNCIHKPASCEKFTQNESEEGHLSYVISHQIRAGTFLKENKFQACRVSKSLRNLSKDEIIILNAMQKLSAFKVFKNKAQIT